MGAFLSTCEEKLSIVHDNGVRIKTYVVGTVFFSDFLPAKHSTDPFVLDLEIFDRS